MNKKIVIQTLEKIATYLEIKGENPFKIIAYRRAAQSLEADSRTLDEIEDPSTLKGIGKATAEIISELKHSGKCELFEELKDELPAGLLSLLKVPGLGGKRIGALYRDLAITDMASLKKACEAGKVSQLPGFGKKTEENILRSIEEASTRPDRFAYPVALALATQIEQILQKMEGVVQYSRAGSLRRMKETVRDLDFIISTNEPKLVREQILSIDSISKVVVSGDTKITIEVEAEFPISIDFRLVEPDEFATTLHHFTGSKEHNVKLRQLAKQNREKISEYGIESLETGEVKTFESEEAFFRHYGLSYIPPEAREDQGEIELASEQTTRDYVADGDILGDLHMHTTWSDGAHSIEDMANAARDRGYQYIAITDHSQFLKVANGLTVAQLREQHEQIRELNKKYDDFTIFTGIEMDILPDGTLDYDDDILSQIDFVIASIHSSFQQDRKTIMNRLRTALENEHVDLIAHPTGRLLGRREGYDVDVELLIEWAKETNTALELNANPNRLDLSAHWLKQVEEVGVPIAINTDAHRMEALNQMKYGTGIARRAMLQRSSVMNTWPLEQMQRFLARHKQHL